MPAPRAQQHSPANDQRAAYERRILRHAANWLRSGWDIAEEFAAVYHHGPAEVAAMARRQNVTLPPKAGIKPRPVGIAGFPGGRVDTSPPDESGRSQD